MLIAALPLALGGISDAILVIAAAIVIVALTLAVIDHRATPAIISNTGLPAFSILPNTVYRACACEVSGTFANTGAYEAPNWLSNGFASEQNAFVFSVGTAAVTCGTGGEGVPDHTGALTQDNSLKPPILLISRE